MKWRHETNEMATDSTTRGGNCNSDEDNLNTKTIINNIVQYQQGHGLLVNA